MFRMAVSILLIGFVFYKVGLGDLWATLNQTRPLFLALSVAATPVLVLISAWKWQVILKAQHIPVKLGKCFWLYIVGYFFNTVLPTNVGGDVVRAYALGKQTNKRAEVFASVFVERFTGLSALLFMAIIAFVLAVQDLWHIWVSIALAFCVVGYVLLLATILNRRILQWFYDHFKIKLVRSVLLKLQKFQDATLMLREERATLIFAMLNSFLFYFMACVNVYVSALAFGADFTLVDSFILTPIVMVITMIPISIGGIGLAEGAYAFTFSRIGLGPEVGLSVALLMRAKALLAGLIGGVYYSAMGLNIKEELDEQNG